MNMYDMIGTSSRNVLLEVRVKNSDNSAGESGLPVIFNNARDAGDASKGP
jgi:hypothetical protein